MSSEFELTPEEKHQVIANRMREYKGRRYDAMVTLELAETLPDDDAYKQPQIQQAKKEIENLEKLMKDLQKIDDNVEVADAATNGNRETRRAATKELNKRGG